MPHVMPEQAQKLGMFRLTRNGFIVPGAHAMTPAACWNFALTGTVLSMAHPNSPAEIYEGNNGILDIDNFQLPPVVNGLRRTATVEHFPNCAAEIATLRNNIANAIAGNGGAQNACQEALVRIVARKNGLIPGAASIRYQLHLKATTWFGWDHWALSLRTRPGRPRVYIQTVTGKPLRHACNGVWDEHLGETIINLQELNAAQVTFINMVGNQCVQCGASHGFLPSNPFNAWHRCTVCRAVYCPIHGQVLAGKREWSDRTRTCGQMGCGGRTEVVASI